MRLAVSHQRVMAMPRVALVLALSLVACRDGEGETSSASPTPREAPTPSSQPEPELPEITSVRQAGGEAIRAPSSADWVLVDFGRAWVSGVGKGIGFYDAQTGRFRARSRCRSRHVPAWIQGSVPCGRRRVENKGSRASTPRPAWSPDGWRSMFPPKESRASVQARAASGRSPMETTVPGACSFGSTRRPSRSPTRTTFRKAARPCVPGSAGSGSPTSPRIASCALTLRRARSCRRSTLVPAHGSWTWVKAACGS